jgi:dihydroflavonol-4-reductase
MILLTGGTGFLGQYVIKEALRRGEPIRLLVRNPSRIKPLDRVEMVEGDVLDIASLERAILGCDRVIHGAAVVSFWKRRKEEMTRINVEGTANIVNVALEAGVKKLVHISSIAALGSLANGSKTDEDTKWINRRREVAYSRSKYLAELEVRRGVEEGLNAVICNPGSIVGAGHWDFGSPQLISIVAKGLRFYSPGQNGFVGVQDVARAVLDLMVSDKVHGERFILVSANMPFKEFFGLVAKHLGVKAPSVALPGFVSSLVGSTSEWIGNIRNREPLITMETARNSRKIHHFDGSKITRTIGFQYSPLEQCIAEACQQYIQEHGSYR